jgi:hypothetical protein
VIVIYMAGQPVRKGREKEDACEYSVCHGDRKTNVNLSNDAWLRKETGKAAVFRRARVALWFTVRLT